MEQAGRPNGAGDAGGVAPASSPAVLDEIRRFWDDDAATYNNAPSHMPRSRAVRAAWYSVLLRTLPDAPATVLDAGAGTGFLSLLAARLGHRVTALDVSPKMLETLEQSARAEHLEIEVVAGPAHLPPGNFDAVMERRLLWTLPDPVETLRAWRSAVPNGRLVLFESVWGTVDPLENVLSKLRHGVRKLRGAPPEHHDSYKQETRKALPFGSGTPPDAVVDAVVTAGWSRPRLERLRDIEWAERAQLGLFERVLGVPPRFTVLAD